MPEPLSKRQIKRFAELFFDSDNVSDENIALINKLIGKDFLSLKNVRQALIVDDFLRFIKGNDISRAIIYRRLAQDYPYTEATIKAVILSNSCTAI